MQTMSGSPIITATIFGHNNSFTGSSHDDNMLMSVKLNKSLRWKKISTLIKSSPFLKEKDSSIRHQRSMAAFRQFMITDLTEPNSKIPLNDCGGRQWCRKEKILWD